MQNVKVLGTNCSSCKTTHKLIEEVVSEHEIEISLEKVEDIAQIMSYGVMSTPAVIIDGKIAHVGAVPDKKTILSWFQSSCCCSEGKCC